MRDEAAPLFSAVEKSLAKVNNMLFVNETVCRGLLTIGKVFEVKLKYADCNKNGGGCFGDIYFWFLNLSESTQREN